MNEIFKRWAQDSSERLDRNQKQADATRDLYKQYETLLPSQIIEELYKLHSDGLLSSKVEADEEPGHLSLLYQMLGYIAERGPELNDNDVEKLSEMLTWPELRDIPDCSDRFNVLRVLEKYGQATLLPLLKEHLKFVETTRESLNGAGTHFYADLSHEMYRVKELITKFEAD